MSAGTDDFGTLAAFVEDELEFATSHYNDSYLERRFSSRLRRTDCEDFGEYLDALRGDGDEQEALLDSLKINVTGFFRNPKVWAEIAEILRELSDDRRRVDAWSAACADGREPYSLSMLAHDEPDVDERCISILGTDINDRALATARGGVYERSRTNDLDDQLSFLSAYEHYVDRSDDEFHIADEVCDPVTFEHHDLINDEPKSGFDLVTCRNLFIYIDNEYAVPVLRTVADSLRPGGYLVIGKAERIPPQLQDEFETVDAGLRVYRRV